MDYAVVTHLLYIKHDHKFYIYIYFSFPIDPHSNSAQSDYL